MYVLPNGRRRKSPNAADSICFAGSDARLRMSSIQRVSTTGEMPQSLTDDILQETLSPLHKELLRAAAVIFPLAGFKERDLRGVLSFGVRATAKKLVEELVLRGIFQRCHPDLVQFARVSVRRQFRAQECPEFVELHRRRALALEAQFGEDVSEVVDKLALHFLQGEAWNKGTHAMSVAFNDAMLLNLNGIRATARIVQFVVDTPALPQPVRDHTLRELQRCRDEASRMLTRQTADERETSILLQVQEKERRDSFLFIIPVEEIVERHLRLLGEYYVFTLEQKVPEQVDAPTMIHFLELFLRAVEFSNRVHSVTPAGEGRHRRWSPWRCFSNHVSPT